LLYQDKKQANRGFLRLDPDILESASQIEKLAGAFRGFDCYLPGRGRKVPELRAFCNRV